MKEQYSIKDYRLDYTIWAAYRAAQAGSSKAKGVEFSEALRQSGVIQFIDEYKQGEVSDLTFDQHHTLWCESVVKHIDKDYGKFISFGVAAKLVNVFLKGYFILAGNETTPLAKVVHPPLDSFLFQGIDKSKGTNLAKIYKWQKLNKDSYRKIISELKEINHPYGYFWMLERYWNLK